MFSTLKKSLLVCTVIEPTNERKMMIVYADDRDYAEQIFPGKEPWLPYDTQTSDAKLDELKKRLFPTENVYTRAFDMHGRWTHALIVKCAPSSHFDHLVELSQKDIVLPDGTLCLARSGRKFHGQRHRPWTALEGNLHLALYLSPHRVIKRFHSGFPILAAVSLIDALDAVAPLKGRAKIKWVNDILIDGAKIAGFLVHTQSMENSVLSTILGIGLNVQKTPKIKTDPFVPKVSSLRHFVQDDSVLTQEKVLSELLRSLDKNYQLLLDGHYETLLNRYRERSLVIGHRVRVLSDSPSQKSQEIASGTVIAISENLELIIKGHPKPVTSGRLILA
jgi:BirA family biotin operon repressor/biotin-[acetyl-CoA-carboxylase] ligase